MWKLAPDPAPSFAQTVVVLVLTATVLACANHAHGLDKAQRRKAQSFFEDSSVVNQMAAFNQHSLMDQYEIFLYGNRYRHPPAQYLAQCFALNERAAVELLRDQLRKANDDLTVRDIVRLLKEIDVMQAYDVAGDASLMRMAAAKIDGMTDRDWKTSAETLLAKIGHDRRKTSRDAPMCRSFTW